MHVLGPIIAVGIAKIFIPKVLNETPVPYSYEGMTNPGAKGALPSLGICCSKDGIS
jgi:hypothetical protein